MQFNVLNLAKTLQSEGFSSFIEEMNNQLKDTGEVKFCTLNGYIIHFEGNKASPIRWDDNLLASINKLPVAMKIAEDFINSVEWSYNFHFNEE